MKIYVVARMVDREDDMSSATVSAHVDEGRARAAQRKIDAVREDGIYGVVETVELDLTGLTLSAADANDLTLDQLQDSVSNWRVALARRTSRA